MTRRARSRGQSGSGQALIELALTIPLLFLLIMNVVNFAGFFYAWITVSNAARAGADYWLMGGSYVHAPSGISANNVSSLVALDLSSLPNRANATVNVCFNTAGTTTCSTAGGTSPNDPESGFPNLYITGSVDVSYPYTPFFNFWGFSHLGINLTLPPQTVHRRAIVRMD